jgi:hypothetical protein
MGLWPVFVFVGTWHWRLAAAAGNGRRVQARESRARARELVLWQFNWARNQLPVEVAWRVEIGHLLPPSCSARVCAGVQRVDIHWPFWLCQLPAAGLAGELELHWDPRLLRATT